MLRRTKKEYKNLYTCVYKLDNGIKSFIYYSHEK